jgi:HD-like signal output (HDOD) protein
VIRTLLFIIVVAGLAGIVLSLLRRAPKVVREQDGDTTTVTALPSPPTANALSPATALRMLYEIAFGTVLADSVPAEHVKVVSSVAATLGAAATDPKYAPRRPMLLPQLLRAVNDSDTTRRELAQLIARDPALVGGLLKLANSPLYRRGNQPIEGIERALAVLGTEGARSLVAAALVQPVFRSAGSDTAKFPEIVWEHTYRSAAAAEVHAAAVEGADLFAAQLIALVLGLGEIVVYRVALDQYKARHLEPDATALASLIEEHAAAVAHRIAASWELSDRVLAALEDQRPDVAEPGSPLGRSVRFGRVAGALSVLRTNDVIDDDIGVASLAAAGGSGQRFERLWGRLSWPQK